MDKILVSARRTGFYGGVLRYAGNKFHVNKGEKSAWFAPEGQEPETPKVSLENLAALSMQAESRGTDPALLKEMKAKDEKIDTLEKRLAHIEKYLKEKSSPAKK